MAKLPEINAGSMADIAFLLLVFFLVTTTIQTEAGVKTRLPVYVENEKPTKWEEQNLLSIQMNAQDQLMVEGKQMQVGQLKQATRKFMTEVESPKLAVVSIINDSGTSYGMYLSVYNEVRAAYNDKWEEIAQSQFGKPFKRLAKEDQRQIKTNFPLRLSEAEPFNVNN